MVDQDESHDRGNRNHGSQRYHVAEKETLLDLYLSLRFHLINKRGLLAFR
jgi:hypothetical protein